MPHPRNKKMRDIRFVQDHRLDDVRQLALQAGRYPDVDLPWALRQIAGWQTARQKIPAWAENDAIEYPVHLSMEQCSSQATAEYKARLAARLLPNGQRLIDLTGGFGVDCSFMAQAFPSATYVERDEALCQVAQHNFSALHQSHISVVNASAEEFLSSLQPQPATLIFLDPARRAISGARTYSIEDGTPNVLALQSALLQQAEAVVVKLSPMLDWHRAVQQLNEQQPCVSEVHILAVKNEVKELLIVLQRELSEPLTLFCVNDEEEEIFRPTGFENSSSKIQDLGFKLSGISGNSGNSGSQEINAFHVTSSIKNVSFLFLPNSAIMKGGCFAELAQRYHLKAAGNDSHLFFAEQVPTSFPGRVFRILGTSTMNKKEVRQLLQGIECANIAVRNFPLTVAQLKKRLHLRDGGDHYLFATTLADKSHVLFLCEKI